MKKNILITGGTGFIGSRLISYLGKDNFNFRVLSRNTEGVRDGISYYQWNPGELSMNVSAIENVDVIINLAGASIATKPWTEERKQLIINSRLNCIKTLAKYLPALNQKPRLLIGASAIGYYGDRSRELLTEEAASGTGFLSKVCQLWEKEYRSISDYFERSLTLRIGIVLSTKGGALKEMLQPSKFGIFGYFGSGDAVYSWIHIDDICEIVRKSIENKSYTGTVNTVADGPVSNKELVRAMKRAKDHFGIICPVPEMFLKLLLGEMSTVLTNSTAAVPERLSTWGHNFLFSDPELAIKDLLENRY